MNPIAELHRRVDTLNDALARATAKQGKPVTCQGKGCCACCYEPVYASSAEAQYLVEGLTPEQRAAVTWRLPLAIETAKERGLFQKDMPPVLEWLAMELPCPLLEHGLCIAYERRPVSCRSHMVCGPADWCKYNRLKQIFPQAHEASVAMGAEIINAHLKLGNFLHSDNLLALLANELLGEYPETASAEQLMLETE